MALSALLPNVGPRGSGVFRLAQFRWADFYRLRLIIMIEGDIPNEAWPSDMISKATTSRRGQGHGHTPVERRK